MNLEIPHVYHRLSIPSHSQRSLSILHHRAWKRRKLKVKSTVRSSLNFNFPDSSSFQNLFHSLTSQFSSVNSLDLIVPVLGLASGTAIYLSQFQKNQKLLNVFNRKRNNSVGDWILFTSPTPFNRFVVLRCPSITFEGSELLEDVNERLVKEDRHFLRVNSGRIQVNEGEKAAEEEEEKLVYQRVCVGTEDGGVLSLDWPENLDFEEDRGLDTTLLIVPGTPQGSLEREIKTLVCECLRRGCFPVVMNPRGCAGSPVTTSRYVLDSVMLLSFLYL